MDPNHFRTCSVRAIRMTVQPFSIGRSTVLKRALLFSCLMGTMAGCGNMLDRLDSVGKAPEFSSQSQIDTASSAAPSPAFAPNHPSAIDPVAHAQQAAAASMAAVSHGDNASSNAIADQTSLAPSAVAHRPDPSAREPRRSFSGTSLWQGNRTSFFRDQRASDAGDILTVVIDISDQARLRNSTDRSRSAADSLEIPTLGGFTPLMQRVLPSSADPANLVDAGSEHSHTGEGETSRGEEVSLKVAAMIQRRFPNGNLLIEGRQQVRVNYELRELIVTGIIRLADITPDNTISYDKIADARISYGGRGHITDMQQPRYGQQIIDLIAPW